MPLACNSIIKMRYGLVVTFLTFALTGCGEEGSSVEVKDPAPENDGCNAESSNASFAQHLLPIFNENCIECHQPGTPDDQRPYLTVELAYDELVANPALQAPGFFPPMVTAGNPEDSQIYRKVSADPRAGIPMPFGGESLTVDEICAIKSWIQQGALYN